MPLTLYTANGTRGVIVEWYIRELQLEPEEVRLDFHGGQEHKGDSYRKINPFQRVPALVDGDLKLFETGAILLYLGEKYGGLNTAEARATAAKWVFFAQTTLTGAVFTEHEREKLPAILQALNEVLEGKEYIDGDFSVADVALSSVFGYAFMILQDKFDLSPYPAVAEYAHRANSRPAFQAALAASHLEHHSNEQ